MIHDNRLFIRISPVNTPGVTFISLQNIYLRKQELYVYSIFKKCAYFENINFIEDFLPIE